MSDLSDWLNTIPLITRYWFLLSSVIPLLGRFGLIAARWCYLDPELVFSYFHIWRPFTALIFYPVSPQTGFHWLMMLYFLYHYSKELENGLFAGRPADYLWMLTFSWICCTALCMACGVYFLLEPMVMAVLYMWSRANKDQIVSFWFGTQFKAMYLPWILLAFNAVLRGGGINELLGIIVGHIYYFLTFRYSWEYNTEPLIRTPQFMYNYLPSEVGGVHGFENASQAQRAARMAEERQRRAFGGAGQRLGD